ncbi:MAG: GTP cyclohydrolase, partial [Chitinophagaceae bacterium]
MSITITEAVSKAQIREFITFPFSIYKDNPNWVPPLIIEEEMSFDKTKNPVFEHAEAYFYIAYRGNSAVGRVAAIINWTEVRDQGKKQVRFGWFDVIDDIEVTKALLGKVAELGKKHGLEKMEGPMGFSNMDKTGALTMGYDQMSTMITWYNAAYYIDHFRQLGMTQEKEWVESRFLFPNEQQVAPYL